MRRLADVFRIAAVTLVCSAVPAVAAPNCQPVASDEIAAMWATYSSKDGAQLTSSDDSYECIQIATLAQMVCRTQPANPAHPSIVIRTIVEQDGKLSVRTEADTAAECPAFLDMMAQFNALTEAMIESMN